MSALDAIWRTEAARVLATLIRLLGDFDLAEEARNDAFAEAARQWPRDGVPVNPRAWLVSTGRFKAIDRIRRRKRLGELTAALPVEEEAAMPEEADIIMDDQLRLIFVCCHPELGSEARIALTLREVAGLTTEEIAAAFLSRPTTVAQRIVRAKQRIRELRLPYRVPEPEEWPARLDAVLQVLYLIFTEGHAASHGDSAVRRELCAEALRLARLLVSLRPDGEALGLLALMLLQDARRAARSDAAGDLVLLPDQDRSLWDRGQIAEGRLVLQQALQHPPIGSYSIQAAIALIHCEAERASDTDWRAIVGWYDLLLRANPSPVVALNRAVAIAERDGAAAGLALVEPLLAGKELAGYRYAHAIAADLYRRLGQTGAAAAAYRRALELTAQAPERRFLLRRLDEVERAEAVAPASVPRH